MHSNQEDSILRSSIIHKFLDKSRFLEDQPLTVKSSRRWASSKEEISANSATYDFVDLPRNPLSYSHPVSEVFVY